MTTEVKTPAQFVRQEAIRQAAFKAAEQAAAWAFDRLRDSIVRESLTSYGSVTLSTPEEQENFREVMLETFREEVASRLGNF